MRFPFSVFSRWACELLGAMALATGCLAAPPPNVVMIFIDDLRADRVGCLGCPRETTPVLDRFAREGTLFTHAFSQAGWSLPSYSSVMTSLYPPSHGVTTFADRLPSAALTLAAVMRANGYRTAAFTGGVHASRLYGMDNGFEEFHDRPYEGGFGHTVPAALEWLRKHADQPELQARAGGPGLESPGSKIGLASAARERPRSGAGLGGSADQPELQARAGGPGLENPGSKIGLASAARDQPRSGTQLDGSADQPYFLWLHGYDVNSPCRPPFGLCKLFDPGYAGPVHNSDLLDHLGDTNGLDPLEPLSEAMKAIMCRPLLEPELTHIQAHYDGAVLTADTWLGVFLETLRMRGQCANTVFVVASDHGELLGEKGQFGHPRDVAHELLLHVPLVLAGPGVRAGHRIEEPVELVDLAPTLLSLCSIAPCARFQGHSLVPELAADGPSEPSQALAFSSSQQSFSVRSREWRLTRDSNGREALFAPERDPAETLDRSAAHPEVRAWLTSRLSDWLESQSARLSPRPVAPGAAEQRLLQNRGYW